MAKSESFFLRHHAPLPPFLINFAAPKIPVRPPDSGHAFFDAPRPQRLNAPLLPMKRTLLLCLLALASFHFAAAQTPLAPKSTATKPATTATVARPDSSLALLQRIITKVWADSLSSLNTRYAGWRYEGADTLTNPYCFMIFASPTLYDASLHRLFGTDRVRTGARIDRQIDAIDSALAYVYAHHPWLIRHLDESTAAPLVTQPEAEPYVRPDVRLSAPERSTTPHPGTGPLSDFDIEVRKPNFWTFMGDFSFKLTQNYVSDNWYKGGESNLSMLGSMTLQANYNNKQKFSFNNKLEMRIGFQSSKSDKKRRYKSYNDLLRLTNELNLTAAKNWSYSTMLQSWTQFYPGYRSNDDKVYSDFMSPFESILTIGMKYSLGLKRFNLTINLSPFGVDMKYVARRALIPNYGLDAGHHTKFEFGSNITANFTWNVMKNVSWQGRFYGYTNYSKTILEWENTIKLKINKFLTTELFLYPRFDDSVNRADPEDSYFQFKEYLSLGLDVNF